MHLKLIREYHISLFMANHQMLLSLYQKRKGVAIAKLLQCQRTSSSSPRMAFVCDLASEREPVVNSNLKCLILFSHRKELNILCYSCFIRHFTFFWITVEVELISLRHCSSRNRKILRHIVHTLKFLAWLSRIIKHRSPKLVAQARL